MARMSGSTKGFILEHVFAEIKTAAQTCVPRRGRDRLRFSARGKSTNDTPHLPGVSHIHRKTMRLTSDYNGKMVSRTCSIPSSSTTAAEHALSTSTSLEGRARSWLIKAMSTGYVGFTEAQFCEGFTVPRGQAVGVITAHCRGGPGGDIERGVTAAKKRKCDVT